MGNFDVQIKKPDWKRTDVVRIGEETAEPEPEEAVETESRRRSRLGRAARVVGGAALGAVGIATLYKLRQRRTPLEPAVEAAD